MKQIVKMSIETTSKVNFQKKQAKSIVKITSKTNQYTTTQAQLYVNSYIKHET